MNGNGIVDKSEVIAVIRLYFSGGPIPCPEPPLDESERADMFVALGTTDSGIIGVDARVFSDVEEFGLHVIVDGIRYCNTTPIDSDEWYFNMGCGNLGGHHADFDTLTAHVGSQNFRCARHILSERRIVLFLLAT